MTLPYPEQVLARVMTRGGELVLTSHRIVYGWRTRFTAIRLTDVNSVSVTRLTQRWIAFVVAACVGIGACLVGAILFGLRPVDHPHQQASALLFLSAFLVVTFGVKRFNVVDISSPGASIRFRISNVKRKQVARLLLELDKARVHWHSAHTPGSARPNEGAPREGPAAPPEARLQPWTAWLAGVTMSVLSLARRGRRSRHFDDSRIEWLTETLSSAVAYIPVAIVAGLILWTGAQLILSMWHSSVAK